MLKENVTKNRVRLKKQSTKNGYLRSKKEVFKKVHQKPLKFKNN